MNVFGASFGFAVHQLSPYYQMGGASAAAPQQQTADAAAAQQASPAAGAYPPVAGYGPYLSSGYFMAAPQMTGMPGAATAAPGAMAAPESSGHVTANATNALSGGAGSGYGAMGAANLGMAGMMAMPVGFAFAQPMVLMPVFFGFLPQMGPQPRPAQPAASPEPAAAPADVVDVAEVSQVEPEEPAALPAPPAPAAPEAADEAAEQPAPRLPIVEMAAEDFQRFRYSELAAELKTSLVLELKTAEGDTVKLDFSQLDLLERGKFSGRLAEGGMREETSFAEGTERVVNMGVEGELDDAERAAIDRVLSSVVDVANAFFHNDLAAALGKLKSLEFDTGTLAELSLQMSMSKSVEYARARGGAGMEDLQRMVDQDGEISRMVEFFASEQKRLIESAGEVLDRPSAVRMVKSLLPPMIDRPLEELLLRVHEAPSDESGVEGIVAGDQRAETVAPADRGDGGGSSAGDQPPVSDVPRDQTEAQERTVTEQSPRFRAYVAEAAPDNTLRVSDTTA